jgi:small subunit ribosomal protein S17
MADDQTTNPEETPEEPVTDEARVEETSVEEAAEQPVRDSGPGEGEPGGSPGSEQVAEEATPEAPASDAPPEETAPAATAPADEAPAAAQPAPKEKKKRKHVPRSERRQRPKARRERPAERKTITRLPKPASERGRRQERRGVVVSSAMDKTIVVKVDTIKAHPRYKKVVRRSVKFNAHDEHNNANVGDIVRIVETRPLSKSKYWRLVEIVEAAR